MMPKLRSVYYSKIDAWVGVLIAGTFGLGLYLTVRAALTGALILATLLVAVLAVIAAFMFPTRYIITPQELVVQGGLVRSRVPLERIHRIYPHRSVIASPAMSLDRLAVEYRTGRFNRPTVWISPKDKDRFLEEIASMAGLAKRGTEFVRLESDGHEGEESSGDAEGASP